MFSGIVITRVIKTMFSMEYAGNSVEHYFFAIILSGELNYTLLSESRLIWAG